MEKTQSKSKTGMTEKNSADSTTTATHANEVFSFRTKAFSLYKLARPNFLFYSAFLHYTGVLLLKYQRAQRGEENPQFDWTLSLLLQFTISITHIGTHFWNEWADYEVDILNKNASSWTGGSKVLKQGIFSRSLAFWLGLTCSFISFFSGAAVCARVLFLTHGIPVLEAIANPVNSFLKLPLDFVWIGLSVLFVSALYSVEPFRLSAKGLGEVIVSYVLTFAAPAVAFTLQGGQLDEMFFVHVLPLFIINGARMITMNIPDREGDELGGKITSVVLLGEDKAQQLNNFLYIVTFIYMVPNLPLAYNVKIAYLALLPLRWWLSLHLNQSEWWKKAGPVDKLPFYESMFVIATVVALNLGLAYSL